MFRFLSSNPALKVDSLISTTILMTDDRCLTDDTKRPLLWPISGITDMRTMDAVKFTIPGMACSEVVQRETQTKWKSSKPRDGEPQDVLIPRHARTGRRIVRLPLTGQSRSAEEGSVYYGVRRSIKKSLKYNTYIGSYTQYILRRTTCSLSACFSIISSRFPLLPPWPHIHSPWCTYYVPNGWVHTAGAKKIITIIIISLYMHPLQEY